MEHRTGKKRKKDYEENSKDIQELQSILSVLKILNKAYRQTIESYKELQQYVGNQVITSAIANHDGGEHS